MAASMTFRLPRWAKIVTVVVLVLGIGAAVVNRVVVAAVVETYSPDWASTSSTDAAKRGLLRARPVVAPQVLVYRGDSLRIVDAWVEQVTRVEYKWLLLRQELREARYRLVLKASKDWHPTDFRCDERLRHSDSISLSESGSREFFDVRSTPTFPDTIRLRVTQSESCRQRTSLPKSLPE